MDIKIYTLDRPLYVQANLDKTLGKYKIVAKYIYMNGDIEFTFHDTKNSNNIVFETINLKNIIGMTGRFFTIVDEDVEIMCFEVENVDD
jgi:hypothetical protein